jgi:large subunit ribosomal protein L17
MKHIRKIHKLGRTNSHRKSLLSNLSSSLIIHKFIFTTLAKAKALRNFIEPIINKSKTISIHSRRIAYKYLKNKKAVSILFDDISKKIINRNGGYTRIIKTGFRKGDIANIAMIELVDYNTIYSNKSIIHKKTRRSS